jgi:hypothetical protein
MTLRRALRPAVERARAQSAERAAVLERMARRGAEALSEDAVAAELLDAAGRASRGLLTREDLLAVRPALTSCDDKGADGRGLVMVPWAAEAPSDALFTHVVAVRDNRGMTVVACYESPPEGLAVEPLGLIAPYCAAPVLRGKPRVSPGTPRPAAAPIGLGLRNGIVQFAVGVAEVRDAGAALRAAVALLRERPVPGVATERSGVHPVAVTAD